MTELQERPAGGHFRHFASGHSSVAAPPQLSDLVKALAPSAPRNSPSDPRPTRHAPTPARPTNPGTARPPNPGTPYQPRHGTPHPGSALILARVEPRHALPEPRHALPVRPTPYPPYALPVRPTRVEP